MSVFVEVTIDSVRVSLTNQQRIVVLREINAERYLPIWIGPYEAEAITIALQEIEVARPQTHDLVKNILQKLDVRLLRVEITDLREDVFYANLVLERDGDTQTVDCRPSDALALAVRAHVPVLVNRAVMLEGGITPDREVRPTDAGEKERPSAGGDLPAQEGEDRLSVFEDFLKGIDLDSPDKPGGNIEPPDPEDNEDAPKP